METSAAILSESYTRSDLPVLPATTNAILVPVKDDFQELHDKGLLIALLLDRTMKKPIIWAKDTYSELGNGYGKKDEIRPELICGRHDELTRVRKEKRIERTRKHGEVFTPLSICKMMCDHAYKTLRGKDWQKYIKSTVLEITCGEAPFLMSRRDLGTGAEVQLTNRVGILDRKIRVISEKVKDRAEWIEWVFMAFQATYGYEFQGDNLLMARMNMLRTFEEYLWDRWTLEPTEEQYKRLLKIISWNIWQMDGLTGTVPYGKIKKKAEFIGLPGIGSKNTGGDSPPCLIYDWDAGKPVEFLSLSARG